MDTVIELAQRKVENLQEKMLEINNEKRLVRRPPQLRDVQDEVSQAKKLPRKIEFASSQNQQRLEEHYQKVSNSIRPFIFYF